AQLAFQGDASNSGKALADHVEPQHGGPYSRLSQHRWDLAFLVRKLHRGGLQDGLRCRTPVPAALQPTSRIADALMGPLTTRAAAVILRRLHLVPSPQSAGQAAPYPLHHSTTAARERGERRVGWNDEDLLRLVGKEHVRNDQRQ